MKNKDFITNETECKKEKNLRFFDDDDEEEIANNRTQFTFMFIT